LIGWLGLFKSCGSWESEAGFFYLKLFPAIHFNLLFFKEKNKRISISIWAKPIAAFGEWSKLLY